MFNVVVEKVDGILVTTSNRVAEELGVLHKDLLEKIDNYISKFQSAELSADFYIPSNYKDSRNRTYRNYLITKKGIAQLIGGYSSAVEKAFDLNVAYINRFEEMEKLIYHQEFIENRELLIKIQKLENELNQIPMTWSQVEVVKEQISETILRRMRSTGISNRTFKLKLKKELVKDIQLRFGINSLVELKYKDYLTVMPYIFNWIEPYQLRIGNTQLQII
ncbi:Rha family transcriptional regulator [Fusobacterium mortiferum]|uniref:Rha family transcriptional regulator n=1 Tax=Fusobacterium mortiferum TaxID=850 RepID=A0ABS2G542_FUSMR|nr:Rha family transcriptional regulator [Fusobacterium mortiferum]MBM6875697.1 Rha family transcriptional regulator [Fusobacterium mortiferum]